MDNNSKEKKSFLMKIKPDRLYGMILICVCMIIYYGISKIEANFTLDPSDVGPKFYPYLVNTGMTICALGMIISPDPYKKPLIVSKQWLKILAYFAVLLVYVLLLKKIGFIICTIVGMYIVINMLATEKIKQSVVIIYSIAVPIVIYCVFAYLMQIYLPRGIFYF